MYVSVSKAKDVYHGCVFAIEAEKKKHPLGCFSFFPL